jgi:hypothetical protein
MTLAKCDNRPMARLSAAGERPQVPAWSLALDAVIAAAATALAISETISRAHGDSFAVPRITIVLPGGGFPQPAWYPSVWLLAGVALMAAPLAIRRVYPVIACAIIFAAAIALPHHVPPAGFGAAILAVYSAVVYSPHRKLAVGVALAGALATMLTFPDSPSSISERYTALIVVVPTAAAAGRRLGGAAPDSAGRARGRHDACHRAGTGQDRQRAARRGHP